MKKRSTLLTFAMLFAIGFAFAQEPYYYDYKTMEVYSTDEWIEPDGIENEAIWASTQEYTLGNTLADWGVDPVANTWGFEATFKAVYDKNYLYLFVKVKDNTYVPFDAQMSGETNIDNIELFFYPDPETRSLVDGTVHDFRNNGLSQLRVSVGNTENRATGGGNAMGHVLANKIVGYEYTTVRTTDGYNAEIVVPWDVVVPDKFEDNLEVGGKILFDINVANCTSYTSNREIILGWSADDFQGWKDNCRFGEMTFMGEPSGIKSIKDSDIKYTFSNGELQLFEIQENSNITVYDLSGRVVASSVFCGENIDLSNLASGIYLVQVENAGSFKIIK